MTAPNDATRHQQEAARPDASTWLSANAGSGKTRVLTDRVARLLLNGVQPQHVLCLTYTKAAASEMQNRLFHTLGNWAMLSDDDLRSALDELGLETAPTLRELQRARTLFARAIETPGGLKIQTIHSFCASLLRRFPLEAQVSPQFTEIEDRAADLLRAEVLDQMADGEGAPLVRGLARQYTGAEIGKLLQDIVCDTGKFRDLTLDEARNLLGASAQGTREDIALDAVGPEGRAIIEELLPLVLESGTNDRKVGAVLNRIKTWDHTAFPILAEALLTQKNTIRSFPTKPVQKQVPHLMDGLTELQQRVHDALQHLFALDAAHATVALHKFGRDYTQAYEAAKQARGWLDYDDLIDKARALLSESRVADWVLYRLDGGIDHILVDEAQDTSPSQWDVIRKLAHEFSSGEGARSGIERTIFVVGDKKQSIYSFQGADPGEFDRMQAEFASRLADGGQRLATRTLDFSFRSSPAILRLVDIAFRDLAEAGFGGPCEHRAFHQDLPGRVDLWPLVPAPEKPAKAEWYDPIDRPGQTDANRTLAYAIARQIRQMLDDRVLIPDKDTVRPVRPSDFLILVRRRSGIFKDILSACKDPAIDLPVAGSDRLKVGGELAVRDLGALLSFLATPDDSLALATTLRSPLFGWSEQELFTLAHYRKAPHLWETLRKKRDEHPETLAMIEDLRAQTDYLRPYDLIERILTRHRGRARLLSRLGTEAEDGINALLSQALAYERSDIPSLTGFLTWMETDDLEIKRQIDSASDQIRIMTVHGAKGLEAPIVILPECGKNDPRLSDTIVELDGTPVWAMKAPVRPRRIADRFEQMREAENAEALRLLYVALTRAEKWLIVAGSGDVSKHGTDWWSIVSNAMDAGQATDLDSPVGAGKRLAFGEWPTVETAQNTDNGTTASPTLDPVFARPAPAAKAPPKPVAPSTDLGGAKALAGEGLDEPTAKAFGSCVHALLERLPAARAEDRANLSGIIAEQWALPDGLKSLAVAEAGAILDAPHLQHLFGPDTMAEVPFSARLGDQIMHGTIDRLIVTDTDIQVIDYKTNRTIPVSPRDCPEGLLRQMAAYDIALRQIYGDRPISLFILWTRDGTLMRLPHDIVTNALADTPYLDAG